MQAQQHLHPIYRHFAPQIAYSNAYNTVVVAEPGWDERAPRRRTPGEVLAAFGRFMLSLLHAPKRAADPQAEQRAGIEAMLRHARSVAASDPAFAAELNAMAHYHLGKFDD
jgi:hypothetical protein